MENIRLGERFKAYSRDAGAMEAEQAIMSQSPKMIDLVSTGLINHWFDSMGVAPGVWTAASVKLEGFWLLKSFGVYTESTVSEPVAVFMYHAGNDYWQPLGGGEGSIYAPFACTCNILLEGTWYIYARCLRASTAWMRLNVAAEKMSPGRSVE